MDAYSAGTSVLGQVTPSELQQLRTDRFAGIFRNCVDIFPLAVSAKELQPAGNKAFRRFHILMPECRDLCNTDVRGAMVALCELPATYARHTAPGSGGASAPWSFSFPAYEESSLRDDCNHPNLTISTGDPRRPVRFIHNEELSFLCVRMSGCACHPFRLIQDILCCLLVPVHGMSAHRAEIRPVRQF